MFFGDLNPLKVSLPAPSSADKYYTTLPPVYNYSHYASIEKLYIKKAEQGSVLEERTPYMNQLTTKAPRGIKSDDHVFEFMKAEEADILLNLRLRDPSSQEAKNLRSKLEYVQEMITTFMQKKNPITNIDLVHYGELPFMSDVEQVIKQDAREMYFTKQKALNKQNQYYTPQNKIVATDPYNPHDGFYLTFEFVNWIPYSIDKIYIKYGFSKRNQSLIAYRSSKEYVTEPLPLSIYNNTCLFGHQDYVKGIKPDRDELLYFEVWYTNKGEMPESWRMFGWSAHELFDQMGVFMGGCFKVPLYEQVYERSLLNKIGLPSLTNGHLFLRLFLPVHFPSCYIIDTMPEHYLIPRYHMKNQDKSAIDSEWKKQQVLEERLQQIKTLPKVEHAKHEGQVDDDDKTSLQSGQDKLWGYEYNYAKTDSEVMIKRLTKQLNKHYLDSIVNPNIVEDGEFVYEESNNNLYQGRMSSAFFQKSIDEQISEEGTVPIADGIRIKITKISNFESKYSDLINFRGALIMNDHIIQDVWSRPCVISKQCKMNLLMKNSHQVDFSHGFLTRNEEFLSEISFHNYQNAIMLFTIFDEWSRVVGWMYAPLLRLDKNILSLNTGKFRVRLAKPPIHTPPINPGKINYSNIVVEYAVMEGLEPKMIVEIPPEDRPIRELNMNSIQETDQEIHEDANENNLSNAKGTGDQGSESGSFQINNNNNNNTQNESTMVQNVSIMQSDGGNNKSLMENLLNKSIIENPTQIKPISIFLDGLSNMKQDIGVKFKISMFKDSIVCLDDAKAKISFESDGVFTSKLDGDIDFQEEIMIDINMKYFTEKNKQSLDKYFVVIQILDDAGKLLFWQYAPVFKRGEYLNIEDFQVRLFKPPFQVPSRVVARKLVESDVICKYGIGYTSRNTMEIDNKQNQTNNNIASQENIQNDGQQQLDGN